MIRGERTKLGCRPGPIESIKEVSTGLRQYTERLASKRRGDRFPVVEVNGSAPPVSVPAGAHNVEVSVAVPCLHDEHLDMRSSHGTVVGFQPEDCHSLASQHQGPEQPVLIGLVPADWLCSCSPAS